VPLTETAFVFTNAPGALMKYDAADGSAVPVKAPVPGVKGRGFRAIVTGGVRTNEGSIVCGTEDGMLFTLSPDLAHATSYGRLFSSGCLHDFTVAGRRVLAACGGPHDAGRLMAFSLEVGVMDLGRPRLMENKNNDEMAYVHEISRLLYSAKTDELYLASGEWFGCVICYGTLCFPNESEGGLSPATQQVGRAVPCAPAARGLAALPTCAANASPIVTE
jgi:hypothetical protein